MRLVLLLAVPALMLAQQPPYYSLGGYGNVVYPGTGHAPVTPPGGINGPHYASFGGGRGSHGGPGVNHSQHPRATVVLYPIYYGGYGYTGPAPNGYDQSYSGDQSAVQPDSQAAPSVVINQGYVPPQANPVVRDYSADAAPDQQSGLRVYQNQSHPYGDGSQMVRQAPNDDQPTLYLIAFKDHTIVQALGYWMEGGALHYVSVEHTLNQVSLDLIDRDLSQRLNDERGVQFKLPVR